MHALMMLGPSKMLFRFQAMKFPFFLEVLLVSASCCSAEANTLENGP